MNTFKGFMERIQHRGPDYFGVHKISNHCFLGNNRLSIIDASTSSNQPFQKDSYIISFNGAIYNYQELRQSLKSNGVIFRTDSDTEVVLQAYIKYGKECVHLFDGMFSFVVYNTLDEILFGARDHFGIKPLYYYKDQYQFIVASEIKQFQCVPQLKLKVNADQVQHFLHSDGYKNRDRQSFFEDIYQLEPGHYFEWKLSSNCLKCTSYYDIAKSIRAGGTIDSMRILLEKAIKKRTVGDFAVSSLLSGGLDSSIISSFLYKNQQNKLRTYSYIESIDRSLSEKQYIESFTTSYPHNNQYITSSRLVESLQNCLYYQDEPISSWSTVAQYLLYQKVRENQERIILSGQGADEVFGGYPSFLRFLPTKFWFMNPIEFILNTCSYGQSYFRSSSPKIIQSQKPRTAHNSLKDYTVNMIKNKGLRDLLHYEDRNSMAFSVETRLPFMDKKLVEKAIGLPLALKFIGARRKGLLLEMYKKQLPKKILNRRKKFGFETSDDKMIYDKNFDFQQSFDFVKDVFPDLQWNTEIKYIDKLSSKSKWLLYFLEQWLIMI